MEKEDPISKKFIIGKSGEEEIKNERLLLKIKEKVKKNKLSEAEQLVLLSLDPAQDLTELAEMAPKKLSGKGHKYPKIAPSPHYLYLMYYVQLTSTNKHAKRASQFLEKLFFTKIENKNFLKKNENFGKNEKNEKNSEIEENSEIEKNEKNSEIEKNPKNEKIENLTLFIKKNYPELYKRLVKKSVRYFLGKFDWEFVEIKLRKDKKYLGIACEDYFHNKKFDVVNRFVRVYGLNVPKKSRKEKFI